MFKVLSVIALLVSFSLAEEICNTDISRRFLPIPVCRKAMCAAWALT